MIEVSHTKCDVRIGNWMENFKGEYVQVTLEDIQSGLNIMIPFPKPVKLSEAWLMDFDWPCDRKMNPETETDGLWIKNGITIFQDSTSAEHTFNYATYVRGDGEFKSGFWIEYVHQLQNLYHSLSRKELIRKPFYTR